MLYLIRKKHKVLNPIIKLNPVNMMYSFFKGKVAAEMFFHNEAVLKHTSRTITEWMIGTKNKYISLFINTFPSFPIMMFITACMWHFLTSPISNWVSKMSDRHFLSSFYRHLSIFERGWSSFCNHIVSLIKKPLFGGLQRTLMFSHLLRGKILNTKIAFPVSILSISQMEG